MSTPRKVDVPDWQEVANGYQQRNKCRVCTLDPEVLTQVEGAWHGGMRVQFLLQHYFPAAGVTNVTGSSLHHHFSAGHDLR